MESHKTRSLISYDITIEKEGNLDTLGLPTKYHYITDTLSKTHSGEYKICVDELISHDCDSQIGRASCRERV